MWLEARRATCKHRPLLDVVMVAAGLYTLWFRVACGLCMRSSCSAPMDKPHRHRHHKRVSIYYINTHSQAHIFFVPIRCRCRVASLSIGSCVPKSKHRTRLPPVRRKRIACCERISGAECIYTYVRTSYTYYYMTRKCDAIKTDMLCWLHR